MNRFKPLASVEKFLSERFFDASAAPRYNSQGTLEGNDA
jgi:hypothetical protein